MTTLLPRFEQQAWDQSYEKYGINPNIEMPSNDTSLLDIIENRCEHFSKLPAFICMGEILTYERLLIESGYIAGYLQSIGLKAGDKVAVMLPNILQNPLISFGVIRAGMVLVSINPLYTVKELQNRLQHSEAKALFILDIFTKPYIDLDDADKLKHVVACRAEDMLGPGKGMISSTIIGYQNKQLRRHIENSISYQKARRQGKQHKYYRPNRQLSDTAFLQYTGGTSGVIKAAMLTHGNLIANLLQVSVLDNSAFPAEQLFDQKLDYNQDCILTALPLYHIFSFLISCLYGLYSGKASLLIPDPRNTSSIIKQMRKYRATYIAGVNTTFRSLLAHADFHKLDFSSLKTVIGGGSAISSTLAAQWHQVTGLPIVQGYGMSETSPVIAFNPLNIGKFDGKVGIAAPNTVIKLIGETGKQVANGERGELCVKGPQVMKGYYRDEILTKKSFSDDGYFKTGDIAIMDNNGFLKIVDRKKDLIVVSGFNVYPNEVEEVMMQHPLVAECACIGVLSDARGEEPKVYIVKSGDVSIKDLLAYGQKHLTGYKRPRHIQFIDCLPRSNVGKILRRELRKMEGLE